MNPFQTKIPPQLVHWLSPGWEKYTCSWYSKSAGDEAAALFNSIREHGVLQALTLIQDNDRKFYLIDGVKRFAAAKSLGMEKVSALTIPAREIDEFRAKIIWLELNRHSRSLNVMEKAFFLHSFLRKTGGNARQIARDWAEKLDIPRTPDTVEDIAAFVNFPIEIQCALADSELPVQTAVLLSRLQKQDQLALFNQVLRKCRFTVRESRALVERLLDLSVINDCRVSDFISEKHFQKILSADARSPKEKGKQLWALVQQMRFPEREKRMLEIQKQARRVNAATGGRVMILPPQHFESDALRMNVSIGANRSGADAKQDLESKIVEETIREIRRLMGDGA